MYKWKVCPVQGRQLKDVRPEDLFRDFRICHTYRGGGGYDQFPQIARKRGLNIAEVVGRSLGSLSIQFVVQLYGCHLDCPYCYVTKYGIFGEYTEYTTRELVQCFKEANKKYNTGVFHLMGGSPAIYMENWPEIIENIPFSLRFHSDLLLTECEYDEDVLYNISWRNALYAVNIKGVTKEDYYKNTKREYNESLLFRNLEKVVKSGLNFYITFTNPDPKNLSAFENKLTTMFGSEILEDSFIIDLVKYEALND